MNCKVRVITIGVVGNEDHEHQSWKSYAARWRGVRPAVRGMAMNPVDHPLGGGEGAGKGRNPVTPWGSLVVDTRHEASAKFLNYCHETQEIVV